MREIRDIVAAWRSLREAGSEAVLATVLRTRGSTYRKAGARMLLTRDAWVAGAISGGCLEGDLIKKAFWRTAEKERVLVTYDTSRPDGEDEGEDSDGVCWAFGLGCEGRIDVLLERLRPGMELDPLAPLAKVLAERMTLVFSTELGSLRRRVTLPGAATGDAITIAARAALAGGPTETRHGDVEVVHEVIEPPLSLVIFGSNYDALPLVAMARMLGWQVTVVEKRPSGASSGRLGAIDRTIVARGADAVGRAAIDDRTAVVVMTHDYAEDMELLRALLARETMYVGVLGAAKRTSRLLAELDASPAERARVHGPIGLKLGGRSPEEIALAIVAEIQATRSRLREAPSRSLLSGPHGQQMCGSLSSPPPPCVKECERSIAPDVEARANG